jgi:hypothetical protein
MWWPHPDDLKNLTVEKTEDGFVFYAPEGTECSKWLNHFNQTEELREEFTNAISEVLRKYIKDN